MSFRYQDNRFLICLRVLGICILGMSLKIPKDCIFHLFFIVKKSLYFCFEDQCSLTLFIPCVIFHFHFHFLVIMFQLITHIILIHLLSCIFHLQYKQINTLVKIVDSYDIYSINGCQFILLIYKFFPLNNRKKVIFAVGMIVF